MTRRALLLLAAMALTLFMSHRLAYWLGQRDAYTDVIENGTNAARDFYAHHSVPDSLLFEGVRP